MPDVDDGRCWAEMLRDAGMGGEESIGSRLAAVVSLDVAKFGEPITEEPRRFDMEPRRFLQMHKSIGVRLHPSNTFVQISK